MRGNGVHPASKVGIGSHAQIFRESFQDIQARVQFRTARENWDVYWMALAEHFKDDEVRRIKQLKEVFK